ncbi:hypothetical protein GAZ32_11745 [Salmonella enterica]|nr:hypothetical protein [Salmonella enterica]EDD3901197.1 hypothetical protein [Salmonella enterica subsp. enterica serovar Newport]EAT4705911.1 hypothetical protein [Salmonella enterica]EAU4976193.1 hypothetical protein [Salmonella enterica]EAZ6053974.1 hypothetical protein [Salmonella enterica]
MRAGSRASGKAQHIDENAAEGVAHVVFPGRSAPGRFRKILFYLFSDLSRKRRAGRCFSLRTACAEILL